MPSCILSTLAIPQIPQSTRSPPSSFFPKAYTREVYFNHDFATTKKLQAGVYLVTDLLGVTLGPKGRNVVLENKYGPPKIVNDGETILKEIELQDPLENVGVKLVRQAAAKTNDIAGDGSTTAIVLARGLIDEGVKVISAGMNPIQIVRGIEKTAKALVSELRLMSREVGADIFKQILSSSDARYGYNAAKNCYEDLMAAGILDPSKVVRCCLKHAASVAKTFLTADVVVVDAMENMPVLVRTPMRTSNLIPASRAIKF